jgi:hypothetical protein
MDTDDLSIPTYDGIIIEAEKFNHDLTLQFGILASVCKDDDHYLNEATIMIKNWLKKNDLQQVADRIFFGKVVNMEEFRKTLDKILLNIVEIRKTPLEEREYEDW